ncbi:MAG TPA: universal stress protein [Saprospiraceae bacterium]|nr:universal stress protein [Saprospiraceae bacterium]
MRLLFPTDFSEHAKMSLDYAIHLSTLLKAELHIIHVYQDIRPSRSLTSLKDILEEDAKRDMQTLLKSLPDDIVSSLFIKTMVTVGDVVDTVNAYARKFEIELIMVGTKGTSNAKAVLFGSVTAKLISNTTFPVLAIPLNASKTLEAGQLLLADDNKSIHESDGIKLIKKMSSALDKKINLLHVKSKTDDLGADEDMEMVQILGQDFGELIVIDGADESMEIRKYVENHDVALLIMIKRQHSLFDKIFFKSHVKEELGQTNTPILIISE